MEAMARNIYHFYHVILVKAHDEPLWTRNSLERSIQWAKYCEKVHHEAVSKGYVSYVVMMLKDMSRVTPDRRVVTFDDLKLSSQLLVAELLQCPALRKGTVQIILESELVHEPWLEVMCEIFVINSILKDLSVEKEDKQPEFHREFEMLMEKLSGLSGNALDKQLDLLSRNSPETLLRLVSCEDNRYHALLCSAGLWTARRLTVDSDPVSASVWRQESGLLCKAACRSPSLMQCLLQRLQAHADSMEPCFLAGADDWVLTRNSPAGAWDWKRIAEIWTALKLMVDGASASSVVAAFLKQAQRGSHADFWDDLLFYCESSRNLCNNTTKPMVANSSAESGLLLRDCCH
ncbi:uncharacterized protein LOC119382764 [Rhipicephalus sanguineus]|uniref:uncharacterized protein LOC119382764 n=1 Tax=Rhipicephalus sanguineus TaxID=34632 RepID=UPI001894FDF0|nr:uncharacterized protein LOC119382764 [Rhipicephalus sanguineus]